MSGKTIVNADGEPVNGTMPIQGGSTIIPGTANKTAVAAGRYVSGNVVVVGDSKLVPGNIKKGVTIFGVLGTCEGYFPTATDLYYNGIFNQSFSFKVQLPEKQATRLYYKNGGTTNIVFDSVRDVRAYTRLIIEGYIKFDGNYNINISLRNGDGWEILSKSYGKGQNWNLLELDITQIVKFETNHRIAIGGFGDGTYITRIYLA